MSRATIAACRSRAERRAPAQPAARRGVHPDDEPHHGRIPRYGSVAGARADQQNVTLDGIDVNDPQMQTAYTSAVRMTQEALQEFRVSTIELQRRDGPLERSAGVAGHAQRDQPVQRLGLLDLPRRTATSSNEYFLKLSQVLAGKPSEAPKLDKDIFGGSFGGPIRRNKLFFFGNSKRFKENSETPVVRNVPSNSMRDGVLHLSVRGRGGVPRRVGAGLQRNRTRVPAGWYGMTPGGNRGDRSAGHRPEPRRVAVLQAVPVAERSGPRRPAT